MGIGTGMPAIGADWLAKAAGVMKLLGIVTRVAPSPLREGGGCRKAPGAVPLM